MKPCLEYICFRFGLKHLVLGCDLVLVLVVVN